MDARPRSPQTSRPIATPTATPNNTTPRHPGLCALGRPTAAGNFDRLSGGVRFVGRSSSVKPPVTARNVGGVSRAADLANGSRAVATAAGV